MENQKGRPHSNKGRPIEKIVNRFGGQAAFAQALQKNSSTVQYWLKKDRIPTKYHREIIEVAKNRDIDLTPAELLSESSLNTQGDIQLESYIPNLVS